MSFDRSRFMKNWWRARLCRGCTELHIGRLVGHNHCDFRGGHMLEGDQRTNGRIGDLHCPHFTPKDFKESECHHEDMAGPFACDEGHWKSPRISARRG